MPYSIVKRDCKKSDGTSGRWIVKRRDTGRKVSCHDSRQKASGSIAARHSNESDLTLNKSDLTEINTVYIYDSECLTESISDSVKESVFSPDIYSALILGSRESSCISFLDSIMEDFDCVYKFDSSCVSISKKNTIDKILNKIPKIDSVVLWGVDRQQLRSCEEHIRPRGIKNIQLRLVKR